MLNHSERRTRSFAAKVASVVLLLSIACLTMAAKGCNKESLVQLNGRAIVGLDGAVRIADAANRNGFLANDPFKNILDAGDIGVAALREVNGFAATLPDDNSGVTAKDKAFVLGKIEDALKRTQTLIDNGVLIKDAGRAAQFRNILMPARAALLQIKTIIERLKPVEEGGKPAKVPTKTAFAASPGGRFGRDEAFVLRC